MWDKGRFCLFFLRWKKHTVFKCELEGAREEEIFNINNEIALISV